MEKKFVIDASMGYRDGLFAFCPIEVNDDGEFDVITGLTYLSSNVPDGAILYGIVHPDGQEAVESFCKEFEGVIANLKSGHAAVGKE